MKDLAKYAAVAAAAFALYWVGAWLYWHFNLIGAIDSMERDIRTTPIPEHSRAYFFQDRSGYDAVKDAGCRALPYLVGSLSNKRTMAYLTAASDLILQGLGRKLEEDGHLGITLEDTPESRDQKIKDLQLMWRVDGKRYHQGWRVWTGECPVQPKPGTPP